MSDNQIDAFIIRSFKDDGTKARFEKDAVIAIDVGAFHNYEACGLARRASAEEITAARSADAPTPTVDTKSKTATKAS